MITVKDICELAVHLICGFGCAFVGVALIPKCETPVQWLLLGVIILIIVFFQFMATKVIRMPARV